MRVFAYIFSIYILALSVMPCSDVYNDCKSDTALAQSSQSHNHKSDHNDVCSPFCTCTCCSVSANPQFTPFVVKVAKPLVTTKLTFPNRDFFFVSNFYGNIWQPPKVNA